MTERERNMLFDAPFVVRLDDHEPTFQIVIKAIGEPICECIRGRIPQAAFGKIDETDIAVRKRLGGTERDAVTGGGWIIWAASAF